MTGQLNLFDADGRVAAACQRWRRRRASYRPQGEPIDPSRYGVELLDEATARRFVTEHHYSASYPAARLRVGLYRSGGAPGAQLVGVAVFSVPMQSAAITRHAGVDVGAGVELGRFVLLDEEPANAETWFLRRAFRHLRAELPQTRAVIAYADPMPRHTANGEQVKPGHVGIIYRAFNGRLVGRSSPRRLLLAADGRAISGRSLTKLRKGERGQAYAERQLAEMGAPARRSGEDGGDYVRRALASGAFRAVPHPGNLVYAWPLDGEAAAVMPPCRRIAGVER